MVIAEPYAFFVILAATIAISLFSTLVYKYATDQEKMARIKARLKELQKELREAKGNQQRMLEINSKIMKSHNEYSMQSMRSMIFTIVPVMIVFIYLQANVAFDPIDPNERFDLVLDYQDTAAIGITDVAVPEGFSIENRSAYNKSGFLGFGSVTGERVTIQAPNESGSYTLEFTYANSTLNRSVIVTEGREYAGQSTGYRGAYLKSAAIDYGGLKVFNIGWLPGWLQGWLATYIIFTLILTNVFRRLFKVH